MVNNRVSITLQTRILGTVLQHDISLDLAGGVRRRQYIEVCVRLGGIGVIVTRATDPDFIA